MAGRLFVCATPIGNLEDAGRRLLRVLAEVDVVAAEDTRRTRKLLSHYGISARLVSYHQGNERSSALRLLARMRRGERVALVADSGTPAISDPGYVIVRACIDEGIPIEVVPGPSAAVAALVASGLPTARFAFEGFLPRKEGERRRRLKDLSADERTFVIFEAPGRLLATLEDLREVLGNRRVAVARELTKVHEEFLRGSIERVVEALAGRELLGEAVLVVEGAAPLPGRLEEAAGMARELVEAGLSSSQAASRAATRFGLQKRAVYQALLE